MSGWWRDLSLRERLLVAGAAILAAVLIIVQFAILPQRQEIADHKERYETTVRDAAFVSSTLANLAPPPNTPDVTVVKGAEAVSAILTESASANGIAIARLSRGRGETVGVVLEDVGAQLMFAWLATLRREHGLGVIRASVSLNDATGTLRASLEFGDTP